MESILMDEDAIDEGVADKLKKRKQDDADKDEGPYDVSDRGLKRKKISKDTKPSKNAKSTKTSKGTSKGTSKSQPKSTDKSAQAEETLPPTLDSDWNVRKIAQAEKHPLFQRAYEHSYRAISVYVMNNLKINNLAQEHLVGHAFNLLKGTCRSRLEIEYNFEECRQVVPVDYFINNDLEYLRGGSSSKKYTTSTTKTKAAKYDISGIEDMGVHRYGFR
ncbi:hypothetical protein Tco_0839845 [Tanacetum coccineum]|uniref:Uncharacterized protein n=1 Tax=Tanacetum coccineum TaxID=301880 RepID=A0ABQ5AVM5_9ASTR